MRWNNTMFIKQQRSHRYTGVILAALVVAGIIAFVATRAEARPSANLTEAGVVAIFDLANTADIETGALGEQRASNKEVREYGTMLRQVHTEVRQKGRDLAKKLGVTPALPAGNTMAADHAAAVQRLKKLSGAEFDRAFLQHEQAFHTAVLDAVKSTLLPAIQNKELKDFVTSLGPAFEAHRLMAEHLEKKVAK
jgi:putative membrane protein